MAGDKGLRMSQLRTGEEWAPPVFYSPSITVMNKMNLNNTSILHRSSRRIKRAALPVLRRGGSEKWATAANKTAKNMYTISKSNKIRSTDMVSIGTWNVRTLAQTGKLHELTHSLLNYRWHIVGLCEVRWKHQGVHETDEQHVLYYSGEPDMHQCGVGFLVNKNIKDSVLGCRQTSSRLISIRLRASPFNMTIVQVYAPTSDASDDTIEEFYSQLQDIVNSIDKKDILIIQGDWNSKVGVDATEDWGNHCGPSCNATTNERGQRLLEFASLNDMVLANTLGLHKASRRYTWHAPNGTRHQIDYIMVPNRFKSGINRATTRTFPGADIGSDHDLVLLNFRVRLRRKSKTKSSRIRFNLDRLKVPGILEAFQATIGGRFSAMLELDDSPERLTANFNSVMVETATNILGFQRRKKKPWVTDEILDLCDSRKALKRSINTVDGAAEYKAVNKSIRRGMIKAKEDWISHQCFEVETSLRRNNCKKAFQIVKDLTKQNQPRVNSIKDKDGHCLTESQDIVNRWTEYCADLYSHKVNGDPSILTCQDSSNDDDYPILKDEVRFAIKSLKSGKAAGTDNIPAELLKHGDEAVVDILTTICNRIWQTGQWPSTWTQSLIVSIPKKGNLQLCQNYRTISLINHASKVMLKVILNRLQPQAESIIAEEQAGFRKGRSTVEQIFNLRVLCEKYDQHQRDIYHVFIDFKKAFDSVWHDALWATMKRYNMGSKVIKIIQELYAKATSAVLVQGSIGDWFHTQVGVRQGCLLSPTLFNILLEQIMTDALDNHAGSVSIGGQIVTNLRFADDIDLIAGTECELADLVTRLDKAAARYGMVISADKSKVMTNRKTPMTTRIMVTDSQLETVEQFKYLGSILNNEGSKTEVLARAAQTLAALAKLKPIWRDRAINLRSKLKLLRALVLSIFLYASETWTLTAELQRRIQALEMKCYRTILGITYRDRITNDAIRGLIAAHVDNYEDLLSTVIKKKLKWYGHVTRGNGLSKVILQGTVNGKRRRGAQRKTWLDNIKEWTKCNFDTTQGIARDREQWRNLVHQSASRCPYDPGGLWDRKVR